MGNCVMWVCLFANLMQMSSANAVTTNGIDDSGTCDSSDAI